MLLSLLFTEETGQVYKCLLYTKTLFQVHDMMDDIAEQQDLAREISEAISNPVAFGQEFDDDELEAELNELEAEGELAEQEELDRQLLNVGPSAANALPDVPAAEPAKAAAAKAKVKAVGEDDELAELAAWAS
jgi:Snf7